MSKKQSNPGVGMDFILYQLSSLKDSSAEFAAAPDSDSIWQDDVAALETAISIFSALQDEGCGSAEEIKDILHDYRKQAEELKALRQKYESAARPVYTDGVWHCPDCNHRIAPRHSYCHWCGKKIGGW